MNVVKRAVKKTPLLDRLPPCSPTPCCIVSHHVKHDSSYCHCQTEKKWKETCLILWYFTCQRSLCMLVFILSSAFCSHCELIIIRSLATLLLDWYYSLLLSCYTHQLLLDWWGIMVIYVPSLPTGQTRKAQPDIHSPWRTCLPICIMNKKAEVCKWPHRDVLHISQLCGFCYLQWFSYL